MKLLSDFSEPGGDFDIFRPLFNPTAEIFNNTAEKDVRSNWMISDDNFLQMALGVQPAACFKSKPSCLMTREYE